MLLHVVMFLLEAAIEGLSVEPSLHKIPPTKSRKRTKNSEKPPPTSARAATKDDMR